MKHYLKKLGQNDLFLLLMNGVLAQTAFIAMMLMVLQTPPEAILDSGLDQVLLVFEEMP